VRGSDSGEGNDAAATNPALGLKLICGVSSVVLIGPVVCLPACVPITLVRLIRAGATANGVLGGAAADAAVAVVLCAAYAVALAAMVVLAAGRRRRVGPAELGLAGGMWVAAGILWAAWRTIGVYGVNGGVWMTLAAFSALAGLLYGRWVGGVLRRVDQDGRIGRGASMARATVVAAVVAPWCRLTGRPIRLGASISLLAGLGLALAIAAIAVLLSFGTFDETTEMLQGLAAHLAVMLAVALGVLVRSRRRRGVWTVTAAAVVTAASAVMVWRPWLPLDWSRRQAFHFSPLGRHLCESLVHWGHVPTGSDAAWSVPVLGCVPTERTEQIEAIRAARPLIVLIIWDGWRIDQSGIYGYARSREPRVSTTPNLDRRRDRWLVFEHAFTQGGSTTTALRHLFTGRYSSRHMKRTTGIAPFWTNELIRAGYDTFHLNILTNDVNGVSTHAFCRDMPPEMRRRVLTLDCDSCDPQDKRGEDHGVGNRRATPETLAAADGKTIFIECNRQDERKAVRDLLAFLADRGEGGGRGVFAYIHMDLTHQPWKAFADGPDFGTRTCDLCDHVIHRSDRISGELFDGLAAMGMWDDAIVILTADHGELPTGGGGYPWHVRIRIPLLIKLPGVAGRRVDCLAGLIDIGPTLVDTFRPEDLERFEGRSLWPAVNGRPWNHRVLFGLHSFEDCYYAVDSAGLQYIRHRGMGYEELFNWRADPANRHNLARRDRRATRLGRRHMDWFLNVHGRDRLYNLDRTHRRDDDPPDYRQGGRPDYRGE